MNLPNVKEMSSDMPTFNEFYLAINQREAFPWQSRLANHIESNGKWYHLIGIPTGLGKTACLDIAVWWLATQAYYPPRERIAPTRIWWIVNRRLLVDSTYEHALKIKKLLNDPENPEHNLHSKDQQILSIVGERLKFISGDSHVGPLQVIRLRGGIASRQPDVPSQPAIILSTLPMYGSRLLFRGYGVSKGMRSIDAAMAGTDSLVLLDEAHLTPHLSTLCSSVTQCMPEEEPIPNKARSAPVLVQLTATGESSYTNRFKLAPEDEEHSVIQKRMGAVKLLELHVKSKHNVNNIADIAIETLKKAPCSSKCIVFVNTPKTARKVFSRIKKIMKNDEVLLSTGQVREFEADQIRQRILHSMRADTNNHNGQFEREHHCILVSTQTLEVGADIDAQYLITEQCGVRAFTQRLGRLNRFGRFDHATAVYIHMPPPKNRKSVKDHWPVYGTEPKILLERLQKNDNTSSKRVNLCPQDIEDILGFPQDDPGRAPELLTGILWEWIKTSSTPLGEAPIEPYFSGISGSQRRVSIIWRAHIPDNNMHLWPRASDRESIDVHISDARDVLKNDLENGSVMRLSSDGVTVEATSSIRRGDQIILSTDRGLMDEFGWNPESTASIMDISLKDNGFPLEATAIERICNIPVHLTQPILDTVLNNREDDVDITPQEQMEAVDKIRSIIRESTPPNWDTDEWLLFVDSLDTTVIKSSEEVPRLTVKRPKTDSPIDDMDERSLSSNMAELNAHNDAVARLAKDICTRLGVRSDIANVIEKAGQLHDLGKADQRFQRWLNPNWTHCDRLMAKSNTPQHHWQESRNISGWPKGGRHESLSARLVQDWLLKNKEWGDSISRDLLIHLIVSHHGKGRPLVEPSTDDASLMVSGSISDEYVSASANLGVVDWEQPSRFRKLNEYFGPWGLALLESILRRSDHAVSSGANNPLR